MKVLDTFTATAPACWASYLVNGDASGLEESDIAEADAFLAWCCEIDEDDREIHGPTDVEECGFMRSTDGSSLGCDAAEYTFLVVAK